jgi:hypothetical protein
MRKVSSEADFKRLVYLILAAIAIGLGTGLALNYRADKQRHIDNSMAEVYCLRVQPLLAVDPRFKSVFIERFGNYGRIRIRGSVESDDDLASLRYFLEANPIPENVQRSWEVTVKPEVSATSNTVPTQPS